MGYTYAKGLSRTENLWHRIKTFKNWLLVCFPLNKILGHKDQILNLRNGIKIYVRNIFSIEYGVVMEMFDRDDYQVKNINLPEDAMIIDAGANIGVFSVGLAFGFPNRKVVALEPEKTNFSVLKKNIDLNNLKNVEPVMMALSTGCGTANFHVFPDSVSHTLVAGEDGHESVRKVDVIDLKTIVNKFNFKKIDLLKLDIEGAEYEVLFQCPDDVLSKINRLVIEIHEHPKFRTQELIDFLVKKGFSVKRSSTRSNVYSMIRLPLTQ